MGETETTATERPKHRVRVRDQRGRFLWLGKITPVRRRKVEQAIRDNPRISSEKLRHRLRLENVVGKRRFHEFRMAMLANLWREHDPGPMAASIDELLDKSIPVLDEIIGDTTEKAYSRVAAVGQVLGVRKSEIDRETARINRESKQIDLELKKLQFKQVQQELRQRLDTMDQQGSKKGLTKAAVATMIDEVMMGKG